MPLGGPRRSCRSGASSPKTERARNRRGNMKVQRFNAFLPVCFPPLRATCPAWVNHRVPFLPSSSVSSPPASMQLCSPGALSCKARVCRDGALKSCTHSDKGRKAARKELRKTRHQPFLLLETPFLFWLCLSAGCPTRIPGLCACEVWRWSAPLSRYHGFCHETSSWR